MWLCNTLELTPREIPLRPMEHGRSIFDPRKVTITSRLVRRDFKSTRTVILIHPAKVWNTVGGMPILVIDVRWAVSLSLVVGIESP